MPNQNGTGPAGAGPRTGKGLGNCGDTGGESQQQSQGCGQGRRTRAGRGGGGQGGGNGRGFGRGNGNRGRGLGLQNNLDAIVELKVKQALDSRNAPAVDQESAS